ncbi:MAG: enoyl-CoA hydratase/isomerase family protein [Planctomycetota bacterium]|nr:enoyl-CoA hydratase/isomerase family protein [Planctomycetota bacterium]
MPMAETTVQLDSESSVACLWLDGPGQRNALSRSTMSSLVQTLLELEADPTVSVVLLRGRGTSFSAGFDLGPTLDDPSLLNEFISGLGQLLKIIRRHRAVIVAGVQGAAVAGGCAIVSACDLVVVSPSAQLGYPVHALGLSPIVSGPTLASAVGDGHSRSLLLSGRLIDGNTALRIGLATHLDDDPLEAAHALANRIAHHGPKALEATKAWLNELDGSLDNARCDDPIEASRPLSSDAESIELLRSRWKRRS